MIPKNYWVFAVPVLLVAHLTLMSWAVVKATSDHNGTIIPDYYNKSLRWDADRVAHGAATAIAQPLPATRP